MEGRDVQGLLAQLKLEEKIKEGAENMLHEFNDQKTRTTAHQKKQVIVQLEAASSKINLLRGQLQALGHETDGETSPLHNRLRQRAESVVAIPSHNGSTSSLQYRPRRQSVDSSPVQYTVLFDSLDHRDEVQLSSSKVTAIETLFANYPVLKSEFAIGQMLDKVRHFLQSADSLVLAVGFHLCRVLLTSKASLAIMRQSLLLDFYIVRSLSRSDANAEFTERTQVLRLVQSIMELHGGVEELSIGVIRAIVAVAETGSDRLRDLSLLVIGEVALCDPQRAFDAGALRIMLDTLVEGPRDVAVPFAYILCSLLDMPHHRRLLNDGADLSSVLSVFTACISDNTEEPSHEKLQTTVLVVTTILKSWAGLISFDIHGLVNCLIIPKRTIQEAVLDILFLALGTTSETADLPLEQNPLECQFLAFVLQKLYFEKLYDQLYIVRSTSEFHPAVREKALALSAYMMRISAVLLPRDRQMQSFYLPRPLQRKINTARQLEIPAAGGAVFQLDRALRAPARTQHHPLHHTLETSPSAQVMQLGQDSSVWIKMGSQMDEVVFRNLISATHVLSTKTFPRWNWDALLELVQGPLHNSRRLEEACRVPKFMKRLVSFYRPFKYRFSSVKNNPQNRRYVRVGKELVRTLLSTKEGVEYLTGNKLLRQIAECLAQLDPSSGITSSEALFSSQRIKATLTDGYFDMLGVLTSSSQGHEILSQIKVFNMLYNICDTGRTDIIKLFLTCMQYTLNGHPRLILAKALVRGETSVRLFATDFLQTLGLRDRHLWVIDLLVTQLYDPELEVCKVAVGCLQVLGRDPEYLDHLISLKPSFEHLGPLGDALYLIFMSRPDGYHYITEFDFIAQEMDEWVHGYNETYVDEVEAFLTSSEKGHPPQHFFGELVLTEQGSKLLARKDILQGFYEFVRHNGASKDPLVIRKLKGCLWALGHIASKPLGASLVRNEMIQSISSVYVYSEVLSLRGTAFYALGLVASSFEGAEILNQTGWQTTVGPFGEQIGIALVLDELVIEEHVTPFVDETDAFDFGTGTSVGRGHTSPSMGPSTAPPTYSSAPPTAHPTASSTPTPGPEDRFADGPGRKILDLVSDLSNQILAAEASKSLMSLRPLHEEFFQSAELFRIVLDMLERYHFKQTSRRFLFSIFDTQSILERLARRRARR